MHRVPSPTRSRRRYIPAASHGATASATWFFSSWGQVVEDTNPAIDFPFAFTGREFDKETGLYYYRARYYSPKLGRFISEDPLGFAAGDTNLSRYVFNSSTNFVDPTGLDPAHGSGDNSDGCCDCCCCQEDEDDFAVGQAASLHYDMNVIGPIMQQMVNQMMWQQQQQMLANQAPVGPSSEQGSGFWATLWGEGKALAVGSYRLNPLMAPYMLLYDFVSSYHAQGAQHSLERVGNGMNAAVARTPLGALVYAGVQNWRNTAGSSLAYRLHVTIGAPVGEVLFAGRLATIFSGCDAEGDSLSAGGRWAHGLLLLGEVGLTAYGGANVLSKACCARAAVSPLAIQAEGYGLAAERGAPKRSARRRAHVLAGCSSSTAWLPTRCRQTSRSRTAVIRCPNRAQQHGCGGSRAAQSYRRGADVRVNARKSEICAPKMDAERRRTMGAWNERKSTRRGKHPQEPRTQRLGVH